MSPFTRDGHLSDLGIERVVAADLDPADQDRVTGHLGSCPTCGSRLAAARADDALPLPVRVRGRGRVWMGVAAAVAVAAIALVAIRPPSTEFTPKGSGLALEVFLDHGDRSIRLDWNAEVRGGDRLGFRVRSAEAGELLIVGVDATGDVYPCWPPSGEAAPIEASGEPVDLGAAIRLDPTAGSERLVAIRCPDRFAVDAIAGPLADRASSSGPGDRVGELRPGCVQDEVRLTKERR